MRAIRVYAALAAVGVLGTCTQIAAVDDAVAPVTLRFDVASKKAIVGDPVFGRAVLQNVMPREINLLGGIPTIDSGTLAFEWRKADQEVWTTFNASHVTIEPGVPNPEATLKMNPGQQIVYFECLAYHRLPPPPRGFPTPREHMLALYEAGDFEFRAVARIGDYSTLYSPPVRITVEEAAEGRWVALELGADLIEKATHVGSPGLRSDDIYKSEKVQRYLGESRAAWMLQWKSTWATWLETDNLVKSPAARNSIIAMRDREQGITRELVTLSLASGYLATGNLKAARKEAEELPQGSLDRQILLLKIADAEKAAARRDVLPD